MDGDTEKRWVLVQVDCKAFEGPSLVLMNSMERKPNTPPVTAFDATPDRVRAILRDMERPGSQVVVSRNDVENVVRAAVMRTGVPDAVHSLMNMINARSAQEDD